MEGKLRYRALNLFLGNSCLPQEFFPTTYCNSIRALQETLLLDPVDLSNFHSYFSNTDYNIIKPFFVWQCLLFGGMITCFMKPYETLKA